MPQELFGGKPPSSNLASDSEMESAESALSQVANTLEERRHPESSFSNAAQLLNSAGQAASDDDGMGIIIDGVNSLVESLPSLVKALDEVSKIHPFIAIAVGAFKVVIELEVKRRDNDAKVKILFLEMRNMMSALLQLHSVRSNHVGRDGMSIGRRLEGLVKRTANDIKECANVCDTYSKKRLLVKILKGPVWDETLKGYIQLFVDRKAEFLFAVSIHTGMAIDRANNKLDVLLSRMEIVLALFEKVVPREQRSLIALVKDVGDAQAILQKPDVTRVLLDKEKAYESSLGGTADQSLPYSGVTAIPGTGSHGAPRQWYDYSRSAETRRTTSRTTAAKWRSTSDRPMNEMPYIERSHHQPGHPGYSRRDAPYVQVPHIYAGQPEGRHNPYHRPASPDMLPTELNQEVQLLHNDLVDTPAVSIRKNFEVFDRKFEIQKREITEEMRSIVVHEGDRVINSVLAGPHERIIDLDLYEIWRDMRWRGIVKARYLVLAIHDYYLQKLDYQTHDARESDGAPRTIGEDDTWTLGHIDLMHLQPIMEALDDDASGFITIQEVNSFTTSRPKGWSLLRWLAYWAIGWQVTMTFYKCRIACLLASMQSISSNVRATNRRRVTAYLDGIKPLVQEMLGAFKGDHDHQSLLSRFAAYKDQEESRLRTSLETVRYDIDALDTLALINGHRGLERSLFPIIYLLLCHHHDILKLASKYILHPDELVDAESSMYMVHDAFGLRRRDLSVLFAQRRLVVTQEIADFACGMFESTYLELEPTMVSAMERVDDEEEQDALGLNTPEAGILKYPVLLEEFFPECDDGLKGSLDLDIADGPLKAILGQWSGIIFCNTQDDNAPPARLINVHFHPSPTSVGQFIAQPLLYSPWMCSLTTLIGECNPGQDAENSMSYTVTATFNTTALLTEYFRLSLSSDGVTLAGDFDVSPDFTRPLGVIMKRDTSPGIVSLYPILGRAGESKARARWHFAISAAVHEVQRRTLSWPLLKARGERRRRLTSLLFHLKGPLGLRPAEEAECVGLLDRMDLAELHFVGYAATEVERFARWIVPRCEQDECDRLLDAAVPCVRCCTCALEAQWGAGLAFALCEDRGCVAGHLREHAGERVHCIVKTREVGWMMERFERKFSVDLSERVLSLSAALAQRAEEPEAGGWYAPHALSTISEGTEDADVTAVGDLDVAPLVSPALQKEHSLVLPSGRSSSEAGASPLRLKLKAGVAVDDDTASIARPWFESQVYSEPYSRPPCTCLGCHEEVGLPCWACAECADDVLICFACDERGGISVGAHKETHTLLRIAGPEHNLGEEGRPEDVRLRDFSSAWAPGPREEASEVPVGLRLSLLEDRFGGMEDRFEAVEDQLARMERMLETLVRTLR